MYSKCFYCGATTIIPDVDFSDDGGPYRSPNHQVVVERNPTAFFKREPVFAQTRAYICGTCGYVALFVEAPGRLYEAYREAQQHLEKQQRQDEQLPRLIQVTASET